MADREDVCVLIPTLNEGETIGEVIDGFTSRGFENVLVIDGNSTDGTPDVARDHGARVIQQSGNGKGQAIREAIEHIDAEYVLMLDGDGTYRPEDADDMLEPIVDGDYEHVIGDRFADMEEGAMSGLNQFGNGMFNWVFRHIHGKNFEDILSGYRAFTRESVENFLLDADGFGVETEMAVECVKHGVATTVVPIRYEARPDGSDTNLHPIRDGGVILVTLYQLAKTSNPLFYFGSVGVASSLVGVVIGAYVGVEWVTQRISHEVLAVVAAFAILFGVQLLMFGVLSDLIVTLHREQMRRLD
ncbi:S-layer glycoprotein N-glycosyltransferase AglJ [Halorussus caseinilyticus]|uniref:S-layer glycoprotein N-glycosyltransferase AglJ n=1 Tax=Halorussus caseinilyticus TaxID=3034025 RepID=A0ABD5WQ78_9EURY|nr:S-layer glycoprotein N-glycosyltransferase AglJ [Halorussus sp. DT72]